MLPNILSFDIRVSLITQHQVLSSQLGIDVASRLSFFAGAISSICLPFIATMTNLRACDLDFSPSALYLLSDFAAIEKLYLPAQWGF
ncbi:MAG TPA: hypothetical protein VGO47_12805 [Chlamydiales bacterium]|jgi:hypothetical protein|nr:hypothetical protein [Chlamydiales bacterium]